MLERAIDKRSVALSALRWINADCGRERWLRVLMSAKANAVSFEDFDAWSATGRERYKGTRDTRLQWDSIKAEGRVSEATLFYLAEEEGWMSERSTPQLPTTHTPTRRGTQTRRYEAEAVWAECEPASPDHNYIRRKQGQTQGVRVYPSTAPRLEIRRTDVRGWLVVPVRDAEARLVSLQFISPAGPEKLNLPGHSLAGTFEVGELRAGSTCYIVEGIGAAWSAVAATRRSALVAFGSGNLRKTAQLAKSKGARPVLVSDRGLEDECERIATEMNCTWVSMPTDLPHNGDINDVHLTRGIEATAEVLATERHPPANEVMPTAANDEYTRPASLPSIEVKAGQRADLVGTLASALAYAAPYYRRDALLVRAISLPADEESTGIHRSRGSVLLRPAKPHAVISDVSRVANVVKFDARAKKFVPCDLPDAVASSFCELGVEQSVIPRIIGVVRCPVMRDDGTLNTHRGYDPESKVILAGDEDWSKLDVPEQPTHAQATEALAWLMSTAYRDFPFADDVSKSVAVSALLTAVIRPAIDCAPLHGFSAPQYGAGKSLQAAFASVVATGCQAAMMAPGHSQEEFEKRVDAAIIAGDPVVILDNLSRPLSGDNLCAAITSDSATVRPLGSSTPVHVRTSAFWMATGQNLAVKRDMHRRTVIGYIDAQMERPETRSGFAIGNLLSWAVEQRMRILSAVYTILRAHTHAGYPACGEKSLGNFGPWSRRVAHCLVWLGMVNPVRSQERLRDDDPELENRIALLQALVVWQDGRRGVGHTQSWTLHDLNAIHDGVRDYERSLREVIGAAVYKGLEGMRLWLRMNKNVTIEHAGSTYRLQTRGTARGGIARWEVAVSP